MNHYNPLLEKSDAPFGAPGFDRIKTEHYLPAFGEAIKCARSEIDNIASNTSEPTFENTVEALEYSGRTLADIEGLFFNILEADSNQEMESIAEKVSPMITEYEMYLNHNERLFKRCRAVYSSMDSLDLAADQKRLLENTYKDFLRNGAGLDDDGKKLFASYRERLSLLELKFSQNVLDATKSYRLHIADESELEGLPESVRDSAHQSASDAGHEGWDITLDRTSYDSFMKFSDRRDLREKLYMAYNTRASSGEYDNNGIIKQIADLRMKSSRLLGYETYADYALDNRMAKKRITVEKFIDDLMEPSLPAAKREVEEVLKYAKSNGFSDNGLQPWDFPYWSERYRRAEYSVDEEALKPYFELNECLAAVFKLAGTLYGVSFDERHDIPVYNKDVRVFDVKDKSGVHLALFYVDFFPREGKKGGAWMTEFRGQYMRGGEDFRPFISIVTNVSKPADDAPALLTFYEFTTILHEFGHSLHGILSKGRYPSLCGTNVARDFVELPSQLMENWAFEPSYLHSFAKDYRTGDVLPDNEIKRISASRNFLSGYLQVRQLKFCVIDMAWHTLTRLPEEDPVSFEHKILDRFEVLPVLAGTAICPSFGHIFSGGYSAGYYSYKWAEVLEADAFSLFKEKGVFNREVADRFRTCILEKGSSEDESLLYERFRGHSPDPDALLRKLDLKN
ncbi:MAG: M3 family metallopeptidase [Bacteroidales bacterium]|jgi:peptidyl-dipeptidase Dcp|nr:M3 family metallopeptidase [Bacteroidales bacterium]MCI1786323.1 M3 family metallopeptidase [Bacteroidales bacterium]